MLSPVDFAIFEERFASPTSFEGISDAQICHLEFCEKDDCRYRLEDRYEIAALEDIYSERFIRLWAIQQCARVEEFGEVRQAVYERAEEAKWAEWDRIPDAPFWSRMKRATRVWDRVVGDWYCPFYERRGTL